MQNLHPETFKKVMLIRILPSPAAAYSLSRKQGATPCIC